MVADSGQPPLVRGALWPRSSSSSRWSGYGRGCGPLLLHLIFVIQCLIVLALLALEPERDYVTVVLRAARLPGGAGLPRAHALDRGSACSSC